MSKDDGLIISLVVQDTEAQKKKRISKVQLDRCISLFERPRKPHFCSSERRQSTTARRAAPRSAEQCRLGNDTSGSSSRSLDIDHRTITRIRTEVSARPVTHEGEGNIAKGDSGGQQGRIGDSRVSRRSVVHSECNWKPQILSSDGKKSAKEGSKYGKGQRTESDHLHGRRKHFHIPTDESHPDTAVTARRRSTPVDRRTSETSGKLNNSNRRTSGTVHPSQYKNTNRAQSRRPSSSKMHATNQKSAKSNRNRTEEKNIADEANKDILQEKTQDAAHATLEIEEGKRAGKFDSKTVSKDVVGVSAYDTDNANHESSAFSDPKISDQPQQSDDDPPDNVVKSVTSQRWRRNLRDNDPTKELNSSDSEIFSNTIPVKVKERKVGQTAPAAPSSVKLTSANTGKESTQFFTSAQTHELSVSLLSETVLQEIDDHAIQVAKCEHRTVKDLVWDLLFSVKINGELEKCRAIFRWLASKNLNAMSFDEVEAGSPEEMFMGLKTGKTLYSKVFGAMCGYAGIQSTIVKGHAKGVDYLPGNKVQPNECRHTWNVVCIYGHWCLIDVSWGARGQHRTFGKPATQEDFIYRFKEYYFLTDPVQFVFSHFPDDSEWQRLEDKVTLEEYETTPILHQSFFRYGFELVSHMKASIHCRDEVTIRLRHEEPDLVCGFKILCDNGREDHDGVKLNEYGMLEQVEGLVFITLRLPRQGAYLLTILAREEIQLPDEATNTEVCEYMVIQEEVTTEDLEPFPYCPNSFWGPRPDFYRFGLETCHKKTAERAEIQIRLPKVINVKAYLKGNRYNKEDLDGYCMTRLVENTLYINITAPEEGEFALVVYSSNPLTEDSVLYLVAQYLIKFEKAVTADPWPNINGHFLGLRPKFVEFGLKVLSHPDPFIQLETNAVELQFETSQTMNVTAKLLQANEGKDLQQFFFMQQRHSVISFETTLPETGFYIFKMYALPANKDKKALPFVYSCLIKCNQLTQETKPFPKQFYKWEEGCFLESPKTIHNTSGDEVLFRIRVPKALAVAVIVGQNWKYLDSSGQEMWTGMISMADHYGKDDTVKLSAKYNQNSTIYSTLLKYYIQ